MSYSFLFLHIVDLALIGNLILIVLFSGYENFVSKIDVATNSKDKTKLEWEKLILVG